MKHLGIGTIIQINEEIPELTGVILIVEEVSLSKIVGSMYIPEIGVAFYTIPHNCYEIVGEANYFPPIADDVIFS